ncbi:gamma-aminobutyric acid type B receptor subunit 2-like [Asterias rubens]|uniref:gamma-aminobutyric acid type B receptor subunit 2-like n=1 Tax=Asterias rubens TaxID=7604 RepID=UPI0014550B21|nr:gamma-aminobutyric acid type B receptor subunit 2-like [Asterias rubens]
MFGASYVWLVPGYFSAGWQYVPAEEVSCSPEELLEASEGYVTVTFSMFSISEEFGRCGMTPAEFRREMGELLGTNISVSDPGFSAVSYDGVWALALGMHDVQHEIAGGLANYTYGDETYAKKVGRSILNQKFAGMSGSIRFNPAGHIVGNLLIEQNIGGKEELIATYDTIAHEITWSVSRDSLWYYSGGKPPYDSDIRETVTILQTTPIAIMVVLSVFSCMGLILASVFLGFNIWKRKNKQIKMSSPKLNNLIACGMMVAYVCVILIGIDGGMVHKESLVIVCRARSWLIALAFTFAFGGMFTKMWRVYSIVITNKTKKKVIRDRSLFAIICVMLLVDVTILLPWLIIDPINVKEERLALHQTAEDISHRQIREMLNIVCTSENNTIWIMAMLIYKAFVVVFGAFLSWSTRNIKMEGLNDSYYVGLSIYNTVICCVVVVPLSFLSVASVGVTFALVSGFLLLCITTSLCMIFIPKVIAVYRKNQVSENTFTGIKLGSVIPTPTAIGREIPTTSAQVVSGCAADATPSQ